jgi:hypothetical protein
VELFSYKSSFENKESSMKAGEEYIELWTLLKMYVDTGSGAHCWCAADSSRVPVHIGNKLNS